MSTQLIFWCIVLGLHAIALLLTLRIIHQHRQSTKNLNAVLVDDGAEFLIRIETEAQAEEVYHQFNLEEPPETTPGWGEVYQYAQENDLPDSKPTIFGTYTPHLTKKLKLTLLVVNVFPVFGPLILIVTTAVYTQELLGIRTYESSKSTRPNLDPTLTHI